MSITKMRTYEVVEKKKRPLVQFGNKKLPTSCAILNMTPAGIDYCPSAKLGLCQHIDICYAMKAQRSFPKALPYRLRQEEWWSQTKVNEIITTLLQWKRRTTTTFRFSEAGDFEAQWSVDKMTQVCQTLTEVGLNCYGYTARSDLNFTELKKYAAVNGQEFMVSNKIIVGEPPKEAKYICCGNCRKCEYCKQGNGKTIYIRRH